MSTPYFSGTAGQHGRTALAGINEDIAAGESPAAIAVIDSAFRMAAGDRYIALHAEQSLHVPNQLDGILTLSDREVGIESKWRPAVRHRSSGEVVIPRDVLLEDVHVFDDGSYKGPGWLWTTPDDRLLVVAYEATGQTFICPMRRLREAAERYWGAWWSAKRPNGRDVCPIACAANRTVDGRVAYHTVSLCVPFSILLRRIPSSRLVDTRTGIIRRALHDGQIHNQRVEVAR